MKIWMWWNWIWTVLLLPGDFYVCNVCIITENYDAVLETFTKHSPYVEMD